MSIVSQIFSNPIPRSGLFATPSLDEIQDYINKMPDGKKAEASLILMFTLNACNKLVQDEILNKELTVGAL